MKYWLKKIVFFLKNLKFGFTYQYNIGNNSCLYINLQIFIVNFAKIYLYP